MKAIGIPVYIVAIVLGIYFLFQGGIMAITGDWPDSGMDSIHMRSYGTAGFVLGIVYLTPVLAFSKKSWIFGYVIVAILSTIAGTYAFFSDKSIYWNSWIEPVIYALLYLGCPILLAAIAFFSRE